MAQHTLVRLLTLCCLIAPASGVYGLTLEVPLRLPLEVLGQALNAQLGISPGAEAFIYRQGGCRYLKLGASSLAASDGKLRLAAPGSAALGVEFLGNCRSAAAWQGTLEFTLVPRLDTAGRLRLRIVDSKLSDANGSPAPGLIWDLSKRHLHRRLEQFTYDLGASRAALTSIIGSAAPPNYRAELEAALDHVNVLEPRVGTADIVVPISIAVPDAWLVAPPPAAASASGAPLTEAELESLDKALEPWDAFLVYTVKHLALGTTDGALRQRLFTLLLEGRYRLTGVLSGEEHAAGDPLRELFVDTWEGLRTIVADAPKQGLPAASLLRYALFIDAGDALLALDRAAPGLGMRPSAEGLRQLARTLVPEERGDPLSFGWAVDPQLQRLFGVPEITQTPPLPVVPPASPRRTTTSWLLMLVPSAHATTQPSAIVHALDPWVPKREELPLYEAQIGKLLNQVSASGLEKARLAPPYDKMYGFLVPTTALIESCWHQYVLRAGRARYLRSAVGSVGIMQINVHVWRGFYDVQRLRWNTAYNAAAGAEILMRYLEDYAIPYGERSGNPEQVPRAVYAVYNAGPRAVGRFAKPRRHPREARVDERLWALYRGIASGGRVDLSTCGVGARPLSN